MKDDVIKEKSFAFALTIIQLCHDLRKTHKEHHLSQQLMRSGTAIGAFVREAKNGAHKDGFMSNMILAQKECEVTLYWLELLQAGQYVTAAEFQGLEEKATTLLKILSSIIRTMKQKALAAAE